jgi:SPP1 family predicted phage head-tail adaptor
VRAGRLSRRVAYQTSAESRNALNEAFPTWSTVGTYWAEVRGLTGREVYHASQTKAEAPHVLTLRYPGFRPSPAARFVYGARIFDVISVINVDERNRQVEVLVNEQPVPPAESP